MTPEIIGDRPAWHTMRTVVAVVVIGMCLVGCVDENNPPKTDQPAVVRVESVAPRSPIALICIGESCEEYDPADQVREADFSSFVIEVVPVEVLLVGEEQGFGTEGSIGPGGCVDIRLTADAAAFETGCPENEPTTP